MTSLVELDPTERRVRITATDDDNHETETPPRTPRSAAAVRRVHQRWLERRSVRLGTALDGVERFMVMGTAGGAAASLAIASAIIGSGQLISIEFYIVLVMFLTGLLTAWVGRYLDVVLSVEINGSSSAWIALYYIRRSLFWVSAIAVVVGTVTGMMEIFTYTR